MTTEDDPRVRAFLRVLDPEDDATGGGTASAVAAAMSASLAGMVARLSVGREGSEPEAFYRQIEAEAVGMAEALFEGGREDAAAFDAVRAAYRLPRETEEEKATRSAAIQAALVRAARVPLANAERAAAALELAGRLEGRSNPNCVSDLICARELARAALAGCLANVEINLSGIRDGEARAELETRAATLRPRARQ